MIVLVLILVLLGIVGLAAGMASAATADPRCLDCGSRGCPMPRLPRG